MKIIVKIGGAALEADETRRRCALAVARLVEDGHHVAVVHGGGSALTNMLQRLGKKSEFVNGLRVTDSETRDIAVMVLSGSVNKQLVAAINATGIPAVGLSGADGAAFTVRKIFESFRSRLRQRNYFFRFALD
jgi:acetylglutamate kinase